MCFLLLISIICFLLFLEKNILNSFILDTLSRILHQILEKSYPKNALPIPQQVTVDNLAVIGHELGGPVWLGPGPPIRGAWCTRAGPSVSSKPWHHPSYTTLSSDIKPNSC